jgi:hypothetical protein
MYLQSLSWPGGHRADPVAGTLDEAPPGSGYSWQDHWNRVEATAKAAAEGL